MRAVLRRHGIGLSDIGLPNRRRAIRTIAVLAVVGLLLVLIRSLLGPVTIFGGTPFFGHGSPADGSQRLVWIETLDGHARLPSRFCTNARYSRLRGRRSIPGGCRCPLEPETLVQGAGCVCLI